MTFLSTLVATCAILVTASASAQTRFGGVSNRGCELQYSPTVISLGGVGHGYMAQHNVAPLGGIGGRCGAARYARENGVQRGAGFWYRYRWSDYQPWPNNGLRGWGGSGRSCENRSASGVILPAWGDDYESRREDRIARRKAIIEKRIENARKAEERRAKLPDPAKDTSDPVGRAFSADRSALVEAGWSALREDRLGDAVDLMRDACVASPESVNARVALAIAASAAGRMELARHSALVADGLDAGWRLQLSDAALIESAGQDAVKVAGALFAASTSVEKPVVAGVSGE